MLWKFTCYNGVIWLPKSFCGLTNAIDQFKHETGLTEHDIKLIENQH